MKKFSLAIILTLATSLPAFACPPQISHPAYLLVGNKGEDNVSFIDLETGREIRRVPVSGSAPHEIAVTPNHKFAAVVNYGGAEIDIFDIGSQDIWMTIDLGGGNSIVHLIPHHDFTKTENAACPKYNWSVEAIPTHQNGTHMIAVSADNEIAYTANLRSGTISRIELKTKTVKSVDAGKEVEGIAVSKDGSEVWTSVRGENKVVIFDAGNLEKLTEIKVGAFPLRILSSPDGKKMVTSNLKDGTVTVLDVKTRKVERTIKVSGSDQTQQVTLLFSNDGNRLYIAETGINKIAEIDFESGELIGRLSGGEQGDGLAIAPAFQAKK